MTTVNAILKVIGLYLLPAIPVFIFLWLLYSAASLEADHSDEIFPVQEINSSEFDADFQVETNFSNEVNLCDEEKDAGAD